MASNIREMRRALAPGKPTILLPRPPHLELAQTVGHIAHPRPHWTAGQRTAWEAARALHDQSMAVGRWAWRGYGLPGVDEHWRRLDVGTYLYVAWMALEALIAPLFAAELDERTVRDDGTATTGE